MSFKTETSIKWNGPDVKIRAKKATGKSTFEIGLVVEGQAKLLAPVDTGRLAGSITTASFEKQSPATSGLVTGSDIIKRPASTEEVLVGTAVEYGPYMEFGTIRTDAQPFLRPALDLARGKALTITFVNGKAELAGYLK